MCVGGVGGCGASREGMCVCVCVCVCERARVGGGGIQLHLQKWQSPSQHKKRRNKRTVWNLNIVSFSIIQ